MPLVRRWRTHLDGEVLVVGHRDLGEEESGELEPVAIEDELYLRELDRLDLNEPEQLAEFSATYGLMWHRLDNNAEPFPYPLALERSMEGFRHAYGTYSAHSATLDELRVHCRMVRALRLHWDRHAGAAGDAKADVAGAWRQEGFRPPDGRAASASWAWGLFEMTLNSGLRSFSPTVYVRTEDQPAPDEMTGSLFAALCIQFRNHVAEGAVYRHCANEPCGQQFVHQRGRAVSRQNRSDAIFCTPACAAAQTQREYRRRQSEARRRV